MCAAEIQAGFLEKIRFLDYKEYLRRYLVFLSAPILKGVRPSVLVTLKKTHMKTWRQVKLDFSKNTGLAVAELYHRAESFIVLIFDEIALSKVRQDEIADQILSEVGYPNTDNLQVLLGCLKTRFCGDFPHEIGLFLGYPSPDVRSFIHHDGKNYRFCYYWKVYHNEEKAWETCRCIDEAKLLAIRLLNLRISAGRAARLLQQ